MPLSADATKRERQLANLKPGAHVAHGAASSKHVQPLRERFLAELRRAFPAVPLADLNSQAERQALISLYGDYIDERGSPIKHRRQGTIYPAAQELGRLLAAYEKRSTELQALQGKRGGANPVGALESVADELAALDAGEDNDGG